MHSLPSEGVVVSSENQKAAAVHDCGVSPAFVWMTLLAWLKDPLQLLELATLTSILHTF